MADIPKKSILGIIWQLGWFGMGQNTPAGCGNNLPIIMRTVKNRRKTKTICCVILIYMRFILIYIRFISIYIDLPCPL